MNRGLFGLIAIFSFLLLAVITAPAEAAFDSSKFNTSTEPLKVLSVTPTGADVPPSRQMVFNFNRPVVPLGRMERTPEEIPVTITPALECQWRWLDTSSLACQLGDKEAMKPATRYLVAMEPGITAEDGSTIGETLTHSFITQRAKVSYTNFKEWRSPGMPSILVYFNQDVDGESLRGSLYLKVNKSKRIALNVEETLGYNKVKLPRRWKVTPVKELPLDAEVEFYVEPGVKSLNGPERGVEERLLVKFNTFPEFEFLGVSCTKEGLVRDYKSVMVKAGEGGPGKGMCDPMSRVSIVFSTPVTKETLSKHLLLDPDLAGGRTDYDPWASAYVYSSLSRSHHRGNTYKINFPERLKAYQSYRVKAEAEKLIDAFGRPLSKDIDFEFMTDHRRPNFSFANPFFVLEKNVDSDMPMVVTNLKKVRLDYDTITVKGGKDSSQSKIIKIEKAEDVAYRMPLKARELIGEPSGVVMGSLETTPVVGRKGKESKWFFTQTTPYNMHVKIGHFNTIVWITDFTTGAPVEGVSIDIYRDSFKDFTAKPKVDSTAMTNAGGIAMLKGLKDIDPDLKYMSTYWGIKKDRTSFFVRATKGEDMALLPLIYNFEVEAKGSNYWYIGQSLQREYGHIHAWGTTAQGVYKAGDTIQYKLYVRNQTNEIFTLPPLKIYTLRIIDPMGKTVHEKGDLKLSAFGSLDGEFTVPKSGAVGWYRFELLANYTTKTWSPMRVLVSDFTPAPFKVGTTISGELFHEKEPIKVSTTARLHSGGPYTDAGTRVTATLRPNYFKPKAAVAKGFRFDTLSLGTYSGATTVFQKEASVDGKGDLELEFQVKGSAVLYGRLTIESAVRDDRGKYVASAASVTYVGRDRFVGIRQKDWTLKEDEVATVEVVVTDEFGELAGETPIEVTVEYRKTTASRVKGAGNAFITKYNHEWVKAASCSLESSSKKVSSCDFTPEDAGTYRITGAIKDTEGRPHSSRISRWVVGKGRVLWETKPGNTLNVFPEKEDYKIGDRARYLVQNPYPGAKALITIERYGILKSWVEDFTDSTEVVEFTVLPEYLPGYYLSVVVFSPRQADKPLKDNVDLGKPAFKMGYVRVPVKDPYKELIIDVKPEKESYRPRDEVKVDISAKMRSPFELPEQPPMELAVAVLDESVLDLIRGGTSYFDPYKGFYNLNPLDLENYSLLMQLVGRKSFEKKGATSGGDGGMDLSLRSLFKFVSYWNPSILTDSKGKASIEFSLPDNLTGWRVLTMAVDRAERMGLGQGSFKTNRPTEIRPVLPNQVTEGDSFSAGFSVMNRTDKPRTLEVKVEAKTPSGKTYNTAETIEAEPYKRYVIYLPVKTSEDGEVTLTATARDALDGDMLAKSVPVRKRVSMDVAATYGTTTSDEVTESIHFPENIRTDAGRVSLVASPTVIGNVEGAFKYMRDYPYMCWEQKLTKGVMASHYQNLKDYMPADFTWPESEDVIKETLKLAADHQAPNGGMAYYIAQDRYVSPYLSAYTALSFNWLSSRGYEVPKKVEERLHKYLLKLLRRDVMPSFYSKGMASTVRAVALAALAPHKKIKRADLDRYEKHLEEMSLFGKAHFLLAAIEVGSTKGLQRRVVDKIMAHANQTGGKFIFSEELDSGYDRILATTLRDNGAILSALLAYTERDEKNAEHVADVPFKLVRTITQTRGQRDRWENTQENMFALNAIIDFSKVYEKDRPNMTLTAWFDVEGVKVTGGADGTDGISIKTVEKMGDGKFTDLLDSPIDFERPIKEGDPGTKTKVRLQRKGEGRVYYSTRLFYASKDLAGKPVNAGIEVFREYSVERDGQWQILDRDMELKTGELVRVDLYLSLPTARNFVVLDDPIPGGLEPVNRDLATASTVDAEKGAFKHAGSSFWYRFDDWRSYGYSRWSFYHKELRHHAARFYSEYLTAGNYHLSYVAQVISPGEFSVMPLRAEEMYDPDVYGKGLPARLTVGTPK